LNNPSRTKEKIGDLVQEYAQRAIDAISSEDVLKIIPVVKTVAGGAAAIQSVRDEILNRKLESFLEPLAEVPADLRRDMIGRLESDTNYRRKVGEHLIEVLDRLDSHRKPRITGEIFAAFARKQIERVMLERLINAVDRLPAIEFDSVRTFVNTNTNQPERDKIDPESIQAMVNAGLVSSGVASPIGAGRTTYRANVTCQKFVELNLDVKSAP